MARRGSRGLIVVSACLVVLGLAIVGVAVVRPGPVDAWLGGDPKSSPVPSATPQIRPSPVLAAASSEAPVPTATGIRAVLDPLVADARLGGQVSMSVVDVATASSLYARTPDTPTTPASTTKLVTAATVLAARGPAYRIETRAVAGANPGEVVLVGGGDPTLAVGATGSYPGAARVDDLAQQVRKSVTPTKVVIDASLFGGPAFGPGWDPDEPTAGYGAAITALMTDGARVDPKQLKPPAARHRQPDVATGQAFARALGLPPGAASPGKAPPARAAATPSAGTGTEPGTELGRVSSPPMIRLVEMMLGDSDNVIAEALARQVALAMGHPASFAGAAAAMATVLTELGLPATESALADGSGLSRSNRVTASLLTDLLTVAARPDRPGLHGIFSGLPVAGYSGTLRDRYRSAGPTRPGAGVVRAKTGTLTGVNAISGIVITIDGRLLAFAVLADRTTAGQFAAQDALDKIATALATCGCR